MTKSKTRVRRRGTKGNPFDIGEKVRLMGNKNMIGKVTSIDSGNMNMPWERQYAPMFYMVKWSNGVEEMRGVRDLVAYEG